MVGVRARARLLVVLVRQGAWSKPWADAPLSRPREAGYAGRWACGVRRSNRGTQPLVLSQEIPDRPPGLDDLPSPSLPDVPRRMEMLQGAKWSRKRSSNTLMVSPSVPASIEATTWASRHIIKLFPLYQRTPHRVYSSRSGLHASFGVHCSSASRTREIPLGMRGSHHKGIVR